MPLKNLRIPNPMRNIGSPVHAITHSPSGASVSDVMPILPDYFRPTQRHRNLLRARRM